MCFVCKLTYFQRSQVNSKQKKVKIEKSWCVRNISTRLLKTKMAVSWDLSKTFCELTRHFNLELKLRRVNLFFKKKLLTKNYNLNHVRCTIPRVNRAHTKQVPLEWRCYVKIIEVRGGIWEKKKVINYPIEFNREEFLLTSEFALRQQLPLQVENLRL